MASSSDKADFAFGGSLELLGTIVGLPLFVLTVVYFQKPVVDSADAGGVLSFLQALKWVIIWFAFQAVLYMLPIGAREQGLPLRSGKRLSYPCNAFFAFLLTLGIAFSTYFLFGYPLHRIYENILPLAVATIVLSFVLSFYLYRRPVRDEDKAQHGNTGNPFNDFFMGKELNPRTGEFDWKFFCELRPGLMGWVLLDLSMLAWQYQKTGSIPLPLILTVTYHAWYVADSLWWEPAVLSTKDIIEEGFGFMLVFGDLAWVPFFYSSQTQYLVANQPQVSWFLILLSVYFHVHGYYIFRRSNLQKNRFRQNPKDPRLIGFRSIPTNDPNKPLLCSGWWLFVRHPNYLGDLMMTISWTIVCGFQGWVPFLYCFYMFALLIHREYRDEKVCAAKYGAAWEQYKANVPYRLFPFVY